MKEIRLHLWDIFVNAGAGALVIVLYVAHDLWFAPSRLLVVLTCIAQIQSSWLLVILPIFLTPVVVLIEPLANQFDKLAIRSYRFLCSKKDDEPSPIEKYIRTNYTDEILGAGTNPYSLCKEFVETNQLSTTFMPFLSKFGFYRSAALCFFVLAGWLVFTSLWWGDSALEKLAAALLSLCLSGIYMKRSRQFLAYQGPIIYAAFLVPHLNKKIGHPMKDASDAEKST